jgi:hypothetical protein
MREFVDTRERVWLLELNGATDLRLKTDGGDDYDLMKIGAGDSSIQLRLLQDASYLIQVARFLLVDPEGRPRRDVSVDDFAIGISGSNRAELFEAVANEIVDFSPPSLRPIVTAAIQDFVDMMDLTAKEMASVFAKDSGDSPESAELISDDLLSANST